ncbi:hypothetical protein E3A20_13370, partial [Planctomyces bekefii]
TKRPDYREECVFDPNASLSIAARYLIDEAKKVCR